MSLLLEKLPIKLLSLSLDNMKYLPYYISSLILHHTLWRPFLWYVQKTVTETVKLSNCTKLQNNEKAKSCCDMKLKF